MAIVEFDSSTTLLNGDLAVEAGTPSRTYLQPASVETALPARLSSPSRYRTSVNGVAAMPPLSPTRNMSPPVPLSSTVSALPVMAWPLPEISVPVVSSMTTFAPSAMSVSPVLEAQERVQVPRRYGRSPETVLRDMGLPSVSRTASSPSLLQLSSVANANVSQTFVPQVASIPVTETIVRETVPAQVTVVEKVVEPQGMSSVDMQAWLQGERTRLSSAMQDIITQQSKALSEVINEEVHKVIHMVNALSNSCEERLVRLEADRTARATAFQGLKRDCDSLQAQIADIEQFRAIGSTAKAEAGKEREEVMGILDAVTKDIRNQHRSVISGLTTQKEVQQKLEAVMGEVRTNIDTLAAEVRTHRGQFAGLSSQKDLLVLQQDQQKIDKAVVDLRRQTQQSLDVIRSECANEVMGLRQTHFSALIERVQTLEARQVDQEVQELQRLLQTERSARTDLAQTFDAYRVSHSQTCSEIRLELESWSERWSRMDLGAPEDRNVRQRVATFEQALSELRGSVAGRLNEIDSKLDAGASTKDIQELRRLLHVEQTQRLEQFQGLDAYRKAQLQDNERLIERFNRLTVEPSEDRVARDRCLQTERIIQELRTALMRKLQEMASRLDVLEGSGKDIDELTRTLRTESAARAELSQTLDAYRVAHLRTSAELRADIDLASEKLTRIESSNLQERNAIGARSLLAGLGATGTAEIPTSVMPSSEERHGDSFFDRSVLIETKEAEAPSSPGLLGNSPNADDRVSTSLLGRGWTEECVGSGTRGSGGSSFGGIRTSAAYSVASDVAEVLADEKRLLGRGLRFAGKR